MTCVDLGFHRFSTVCLPVIESFNENFSKNKCFPKDYFEILRKKENPTRNVWLRLITREEKEVLVRGRTRAKYPIMFQSFCKVRK